MSERKRYARYALRGATGVAIFTVGALAIAGLNRAEIPDVRAKIPAFDVTTAGISTSTVVCQGSFGVLGLNPSSPNDVTPIGSATVKLNRDDTEALQLATELPGSTPPTAYSLPATETLRGAVTQTLGEETVRGRAAAACGEAANEQWLVGGSTERGFSGVITLSNPGTVPATVTLTVFDENGEVSDVGTSGVLVPAGSERAVPLNGFGAGRASTAVRVQSVGSPVFATLGVHQIVEITPIGADVVNAQYGAAEVLVFAGVKTFENRTHGEEHGSGSADAPVRVRLLSPEVETRANITGLTADGERIELATVDLEPGIVTDTGIAELADRITSIRVESADPIVGGVMTVLHNNTESDFMWMTPSTAFSGDDSTPAVTLAGGALTIVNLSEHEAEVTVGEKTIPFAGFASKTLKVGEVESVSSSAPFALGVTLFDEHTLSSYPVLGFAQQIEGFTVFTR